MTIKELQQIRKKYKISQCSTAKELGVNISSMNQWENGKEMFKNIEAGLIKRYKLSLSSRLEQKKNFHLEEIKQIEKDLKKLK